MLETCVQNFVFFIIDGCWRIWIYTQHMFTWRSISQRGAGASARNIWSACEPRLLPWVQGPSGCSRKGDGCQIGVRGSFSWRQLGPCLAEVDRPHRRWRTWIRRLCTCSNSWSTSFCEGIPTECRLWTTVQSTPPFPSMCSLEFKNNIAMQHFRNV